MKLTRKVFLIPIVVIVTMSIACNLLNLINNSNSAVENGPEETNSITSDTTSPDSTTPDSASSPMNNVDVNAFSGDFSLPLVKTDTKSYSDDKYLGKKIPVEVIFSNGETADILFAGGVAEPDMSVSDTPPMRLLVFAVLQKSMPSVLYQGEYSISIDYLSLKSTLDLLDSNGTVILTHEYQVSEMLYPNYPQVIDYTLSEMPDNTATARLNITAQPSTLGISDVDVSDLSFQMPTSITNHTPVQFNLVMDDWNETYAKKGVVAEYQVVYQNPLNAELFTTSTVLFLDNESALVGYMNPSVYMEANGTNNNFGSGWQSSYLAGEPSQVLIYDRWGDFSDFVIASR